MVDEKKSVWVFISFPYQNACREDRSCWDLWETDLSRILQLLPVQ